VNRAIYEANRDLFQHVSKNTGENITDIVNLGTYLLIPARVADPDLFGRIRSRIRKIFTGAGSGSYRYFGNVKLYKQEKIF